MRSNWPRDPGVPGGVPDRVRDGVRDPGSRGLGPGSRAGVLGPGIWGPGRGPGPGPGRGPGAAREGSPGPGARGPGPGAREGSPGPGGPRVTNKCIFRCNFDTFRDPPKRVVLCERLWSGVKNPKNRPCKFSRKKGPFSWILGVFGPKTGSGRDPILTLKTGLFPVDF